MGRAAVRLTARDLTRMGVEIHLGAMVTGMDEDGVEITKSDGSHERIPAATKVWAAGTRAAGLGAIARRGGGRGDWTRRAGSWSSPTARCRAIPRSSSWAT